jgi:hypothetical protein
VRAETFDVASTSGDAGFGRTDRLRRRITSRRRAVRPRAAEEGTMTTIKRLINPAGMLAFLLGQAALLWGVVLAPAYWLGFALLAPQGGRSVTGLDLSPVPPVIGLAMALVALRLARAGWKPGAGLSVAGIVLNAVALAIAIALLLLRTIS